MSFENYGGIYVPRLTFVNKVILIVCGVYFLLQSILGHFLSFSWESYLGLSPFLVKEGHIYQFFTYPLVQTDLISFIFNGLILWFIGSDLEMSWGRKVYIKFLLICQLGAGLCYFLIISIFFTQSLISSTPLIGLSGICYALLFAYGLMFKDRILTFMLVFPMKAKYFCMLIVGIELYMGIFSRYGKSAWGHLGAFATAYLFLRFSSSQLKWGGYRGFMLKRKKKSIAPLYLVKEDIEKDKEKDNDSSSKNGPKIWH